jgi:hypothetical protein
MAARPFSAGDMRAQGLPLLVTRTFSPLPTRRSTSPVRFFSSLALMDFMASSYFIHMVASRHFQVKTAMSSIDGARHRLLRCPLAQCSSFVVRCDARLDAMETIMALLYS